MVEVVTPLWRECEASIVKGVAHHSDLELLRAFQRQPQAARYFIALFCRYCAWVDGILAEHLPPEQRAAWREEVWLRLYARLQHLDVRTLQSEGGGDPVLAPWLAAQIRELIWPFAGRSDGAAEGEAAPPQTASAGAAKLPLSPALACYLSAALDNLPGDMRFILLLRDRFGWSPERIAAQLKADRYYLAPEEVDAIVASARQLLLQHLPADVRALYLAANP